MTLDPRSFDAWVSFLQTALEDCHDKLEEIFDASSVRELWLQGELYLAAKIQGWQHLYVNYSNLDGYSGTPDLTCCDSDAQNANLLMLGEVKLLGTDTYFSKNFDGYSSVRVYHEELSTNGTLLIESSRLEKKPPLGGLLRDYKRLVDYPENVLKMLVVVLDMRGECPNDLGELLLAVEFERQGAVVFKNDHVLCKAWEVKGPPTANV